MSSFLNSTEDQDGKYALEEDHGFPMPDQIEHLDGEDENNLAELDAEFGDDGPDEFEEHSGLVDEEMEKQMDELTKDMENIDEFKGAPKGEVPAGALPTDKGGRLSSHAAEFWFPDCRNCSCCKGYKHGCECVKKERFIACQHESCNLDPSHKGQKLPEDSIPTSRAPTENSYQQGRRAFSEGTTICRFEQQQPGSCRFGANCRFLHPNSRNQQNQNHYRHNDLPPGDEYFKRSVGDSGRGYQTSGYQSSGGYNPSSQRYDNQYYYQQQHMHYNQSGMQHDQYPSQMNYYDNSSNLQQNSFNQGYSHYHHGK